MPVNRFYLLTLLLILGVLTYLNYQVFQPFMTAITWVIVFALSFIRHMRSF